MYREGLGSWACTPQGITTAERTSAPLAARRRPTGFSVALDATQLARFHDPPVAGEVGRVGVPIDSLRDMVCLLDGVPRQVRQSAHANSIGPIAVGLFKPPAETRIPPTPSR